MKPILIILLAIGLVGCGKPIVPPPEKTQLEPIVAAQPDPLPDQKPTNQPVPVVTQRVVYYAPAQIAHKPIPAKSQLQKLVEQRASTVAQWETENGRRWHSPQDNQVRLRTMRGLSDQIRALDVQIRQEKAKGAK